MQYLSTRVLLAASVTFLITLSAPTGVAQESFVQADSLIGEKENRIAKGDVVIKFGKRRVEAQYAELNMKTGRFRAKDGVSVTLGEKFWSGQKVSGNIRKGTFEFGEFEAAYPVQEKGVGKWYVRGEEGKRTQKEHFVFNNAEATSCEYLLDDPSHAHYSVTASKFTRYKSGSYLAKNVFFRLGGVPVFYLPYWYGDSKSGTVSLSPGYDSELGAFLFTSKKWQITPQVSTTLHADVWSDRGYGIGDELHMEGDNYETDLFAYGMRDEKPVDSDDRMFNHGFEVEKNRYRLQLSHHQAFSPRLSLHVQADVLSDFDMLEDWFEDEYQDSPQPENTAYLNYQGDWFSLSMGARAQLNSFYTVVERLPELKMRIPRQPLGWGQLHYEGRSSAEYLRRKWRDFDDPAYTQTPSDYESWRLDTLHMLYRPVSLGKWGTLVPRAGVRFTYYSDSSEQEVDIDDLVSMFSADDPDNQNANLGDLYDEDGGSRFRTTGEIGFEWSRKFYRTRPHMKNNLLKLSGNRHVVMPYINYTFIPEPTEDSEHLFFFDRIDRLRKYHFTRFGVRQRWQTVRDDRIYTYASLDTFTDFHFEDEVEGQRDEEHWGDIGVRGTFQPREGLDFTTSLLANAADGDVLRSSLAATIGDPRVLEGTLKYVYLDEHADRPVLSMGSSLFASYARKWLPHGYTPTHELSARLNFDVTSKTRAFVAYGYDLEEAQSARKVAGFSRDLHCWKGRFAVEQTRDETTFLVTLRLKAHPSLRLGASPTVDASGNDER